MDKESVHNLTILMVLDNYFPYIGGAETMFQKVAEGLIELGYEVVLVCPLIIKKTAKFEIINGVQVHRVLCGNRYLYTFLALPLVLKLAKKASLIHTTTYNAAPIAWLSGKITKKKVIITIHELLGKLWWQRLNFISALGHWGFERFLIKLPFDRFIAVSNSTRRSLTNRKVDSERIFVIYHGIDDELFNPNNVDVEDIRRDLGVNKHFTYLFFGRPGISKGLEFLIRAVPKIKDNIPESKLILLLGSEPHSRFRMIKKLIIDLNISENVIVLESVSRSELPNYLSAADCVVVPSLSEGFGFSAAESCALDRPIVVSEVGALPEVVSGRVCWVKPGDSNSIYDGVLAAYNKQWELIPKKKFHWKDSIEKYVRVFKELCE
ncbi:MAG: glycosyltransferase family 4 protein [Candidatus Tenebribacter burtonii]|jgi:glycosyltransferase involved in cell wall biosynthesis|nr:glycosyltransferase family 4 protein [Candidatus Tenebribacter burtonii]